MRHHALRVTLGALLLIAFVSPSPTAADEPPAAPGRALVRLAPGIRTASALGVTSLRDQGIGGWHVVEFDPAIDPHQRARDMRRLPGVIDAEPDYIYRITDAPNDPLYPNQWNLPQVQAEQVWNVSTGANVVVAVLDTGLLPGMTDGPLNVRQGYNFSYNTNDTTDDNGHGSHVSNTIAERTNNGFGLAGLAYDATILPVKVCNANGDCQLSAIQSGLRFARDNGAKVVNLSLGGSANSAAFRLAVEDVIASGVIIVAAMGNDGGPIISYPAAYPNVVAVGATQLDGQRAPYSNTGSYIWVAAPGGNRSLDQNGDGNPDLIYQQTLGRTCSSASTVAFCGLQGTSMAVPHVAATVALMLSVSPTLSVGQVRSILAATAKDLESGGFDTNTGYGLIQAYDATLIARSTSGSGITGNVQTANVLIVQR